MPENLLVGKMHLETNFSKFEWVLNFRGWLGRFAGKNWEIPFFSAVSHRKFEILSDLESSRDGEFGDIKTFKFYPQEKKFAKRLKIRPDGVSQKRLQQPPAKWVSLESPQRETQETKENQNPKNLKQKRVAQLRIFIRR